MIVGLSVFDAVLDRLSRDEADAPEPGLRSWRGVRGLNSSFVGTHSGPECWRSEEQPEAAYSVYSAFDNDTVAPPPEPQIDMSMFNRLCPEDIARDIDLLPSDTSADLQHKRRTFARMNHPDRIPSEWRDAATTRMKIANQLFDEALGKLKAKQP